MNLTMNIGRIKKPKAVSKKTSKSSVSRSKASSSKKGVNEKEFLVSEVASRWWYVLPEWPPVNHDYTPSLSSQSLRQVPVEKFPLEPETDQAGRKKVSEVD